MNNLICRKNECDNIVECDIDVVAITCSECCATLGVDNNIVFGGQNGFSQFNSSVWIHGSNWYRVINCLGKYKEKIVWNFL